MTPVPLHYIWEGPLLGEPVVLSGSLGSNLRMWDPQVSALTAAGYRVLRYDHPATVPHRCRRDPTASPT